jgi:hypothetical protein
MSSNAITGGTSSQHAGPGYSFAREKCDLALWQQRGGTTVLSGGKARFA